MKRKLGPHSAPEPRSHAIRSSLRLNDLAMLAAFKVGRAWDKAVSVRIIVQEKIAVPDTATGLTR